MRKREVIEPVLLRYAYVFHDEENNDFMGTDLTEHEILTRDDTPIRRPPYRVPYIPVVRPRHFGAQEKLRRKT